MKASPDFKLDPKSKVNGKAEPETAAEPLPFVTFANLHANLDVAALVKHLIGTTAMSVLYGNSGTGKTHLVVDMALHIALGWKWFGRNVTRGSVLYVAGEGRNGISNRVAAFRLHHNITEDVPFAVIPAPVDLRSENAETDRLIATIKEVAATFDCPLVLLVIDTLSRALAGGNENDSADMGAYVMHIDRIKAATQAHILSIHHCGKDQARGARGHSLLRAATDTEIEVTREDGTKISVARATKQRDLPDDVDPIMFRLEPVELGIDADGDRVTACVVRQAEGTVAPRPEKKPPAMPPSAKIALTLLRKAINETGEAAPASNHIPAACRVVTAELWRNHCYLGQVSESDDQAAKRQAFKRSADVLVSRGIVGKWEQWVWLCERGAQA